ncbi:MAG: CRISPR-associated helicase/endonuclease Cas3 [Patescibacteria group bacterium]|uniref:CRISPR-associated helicase Cas3' n=1 Tax=Thermonema sp. TaxID=2231181 RepID=UPI0021DDFB66|nr:CRISPR-associated helicase Cas3' [Thermonema sp.]GIV39350.1 MAG: CRISPR-associated helicase/endonuclease Cas3 [Thermonema sp.]GIW61083.1 MAG: CRISPR-associated helicase/endonuclease Cas3 [Patescibacteria group bacterium]
MCARLKYQSHPGKPLEKHIEGVVQKALHRSPSPVVKWAAYFHDLGKINPFFQQKLEKKEVNGYSAHAYLSALAWLAFFLTNNQSLRQEIKEPIYIYIIFLLIIKHHGNLPDIEHPTSREHLSQLKSFLEENPHLPFSDFLRENLGIQHNSFEISNIIEKLGSFIQKIVAKWQDKPLDYFMDTQFAFASLIEADKRDAGNNELYALPQTIERLRKKLPDALTNTFHRFSADNDLNKQRIALRKEAESRLRTFLNEGKSRIFTLTAPTGAGKTLTLLRLASIIQEKYPEMGIVYALPFLSIIEQTQAIAEKLLEEELVLAVSSKAHDKNMEKLIEQLDYTIDESLLDKLLKRDFLRTTFDHPFVITTFVQLFETLLSNRNATLLKLPNLSNRIFLIDEIQALPPRLYIFFAAWLQAFCERNQCFAILSSATMPEFIFPEKPYLPEERKPQKLFPGYSPPAELLEYTKYFQHACFNRYKIIRHDPFELDYGRLVSAILQQDKSCLVIVNTIQSSKELYKALKAKLLHDRNTWLFLLNTHFTPHDRRRKIREIQQSLQEGKQRVIFISTQLIEAGVDIDFPVVYRDLCPLPALIQSAGRCNRNNKLPEGGHVFLFHLKSEGKSFAKIVYKDFRGELNNMEAELFKNCTEIEEKNLVHVQKRFFERIARNLSIGDCEIWIDGQKQNHNLIELVYKGKFETMGRFRLIQEETYGETYQYYIAPDIEHDPYRQAETIAEQIGQCPDYRTSLPLRLKLSQLMRHIQDYTINVRLPRNATPPVYSSDSFGIRSLANRQLYSYEYGLDIQSTVDLIL